MRSRLPLLALLLVAVIVYPDAAHAGGIPFFGPIIPGENSLCPLGWGMFITVVNNVISFLLTLAIVFVAPIMIAYAGFLFVVNPLSSEGISRARGLLTNVFVGILISLAAWMLIDAVMAALYDSTRVGKTWTELVSGGGATCLKQAGADEGDVLNQVTGMTVTSSGTAFTFGTGGNPCSATVLQGLLPSLTLAEANTFACLAHPESSCGGVMQNNSWNKVVPNSGGKASTAYGAYQVTLSGNHAAFENSACYAAAGVAGPLNCQNGFGPNGFTAGGNPTVLANCTKAASNLACNLAAAMYVKQHQGWGAWTADAKHASQQACITQYGG